MSLQRTQSKRLQQIKTLLQTARIRAGDTAADRVLVRAISDYATARPRGTTESTLPKKMRLRPYYSASVEKHSPPLPENK